VTLGWARASRSMHIPASVWPEPTSENMDVNLTSMPRLLAQLDHPVSWALTRSPSSWHSHSWVSLSVLSLEQPNRSAVGGEIMGRDNTSQRSRRLLDHSCITLSALKVGGHIPQPRIRWLVCIFLQIVVDQANYRCGVSCPLAGTTLTG